MIFCCDKNDKILDSVASRADNSGLILSGLSSGEWDSHELLFSSFKRMVSCTLFFEFLELTIKLYIIFKNKKEYVNSTQFDLKRNLKVFNRVIYSAL